MPEHVKLCNYLRLNNKSLFYYIIINYRLFYIPCKQNSDSPPIFNSLPCTDRKDYEEYLFTCTAFQPIFFAKGSVCVRINIFRQNRDFWEDGKWLFFRTHICGINVTFHYMYVGVGGSKTFLLPKLVREG